MKRPEEFLLFSFILAAILGFIGNKLEFTVAGVPVAPLIADAPGALEVLNWFWNTGAFIIGMVSFRVDGVPWVISAVLLLIVLMDAVFIVKLVRGV